MIAYCAFCKTTFEEKTAQHINRLYGAAGVKAIAPVRILKERFKGVVHEIRRPLLKGYVFIFSESKLKPGMMNPVQDVIKLLSYQTGECELMGADLDYARFVHGSKGVIGISDVLCEGREVKIISGPLEECKGTIVKLDRRHERVAVRMAFGGVERDISLSVNILSVV